MSFQLVLRITAQQQLNTLTKNYISCHFRVHVGFSRGHSLVFMTSAQFTSCQLGHISITPDTTCQSRRGVVYLPRPFCPPSLSAPALCWAPRSHLPSRQRQRATRTRQGAKRRVFGGTTVKMSSGTLPSGFSGFGGGGWGCGWRRGGESATDMNIHRAWAPSCAAY